MTATSTDAGENLPETLVADPAVEQGDEAVLAGPDLTSAPVPTSPERRGRLRAFFGLLGPGLVTGVADDDPSGVATYAQAGARFGPGLLWTVPVALPLMAATQEICDRTALATGDSLGTLVRKRFGRRATAVIGVLVVALLVANCLNIAADLAAVGQGMEMLHAGPDHLWVVAVGAGLTIALVVGTFERIAAVFKWLCVVLLVYVAVLFAAHVRWGEVGLGLVGARMHWSWAAAGMLVAILGTSISPYMFFWQSAHRIESMRAETGHPEASMPLPQRHPHRAAAYLRGARLDVFLGMFVSTAAMFAIMVATAETIGRQGSTKISTAADAAKALRPIAGSAAEAVFALGFIGTGLLAVPVLSASGSVALAGLLNRPWGFNRSLRGAPAFYALVVAGTLGGVLIALFSKNVIGLLVLSAVVNGIAAAPFLVCTMLVASDRGLMGRYRNGRLASVVGWTTTAVMAVAGVIGIFVTVTGR